MELYFVATNASSAENEVIKKLQPKRLLLSYFYFKNKPLKEFCELIGYKPKIMLDSGAWSAYNKGKGIALTDYMNYIEANKDCIEHYINLDVIGDSEMSYDYYNIMKKKGFNPIPVFHYGEDEEHLKKYDSKYIALGGSVVEKNKAAVSEWVRFLTWSYPEKEFHLLGSSSNKIINHCNIKSVDSSTWFMMAINGFPKEIKGNTREAKVKRAAANMNAFMEVYG